MVQDTVDAGADLVEAPVAEEAEEAEDDAAAALPAVDGGDHSGRGPGRGRGRGGEQGGDEGPG